MFFNSLFYFFLPPPPVWKLLCNHYEIPDRPRTENFPYKEFLEKLIQAFQLISQLYISRAHIFKVQIIPRAVLSPSSKKKKISPRKTLIFPEIELLASYFSYIFGNKTFKARKIKKIYSRNVFILCLIFLETELSYVFMERSSLKNKNFTEVTFRA